MRRAAAGLVLVAALAACGATPAPLPTPVPSAPPATSAAPPAASATASASASASPTATTPVATTPGARAVEDPSLLEVLPAEVDGHPVEPEPFAFADAMADEGFATSIRAAAFGVVVAGTDLASAVVARPVDGAFDEGWFRDWRDSYDDGACSQAGGVVGNAEALLGGRTVHIGTCAGGLRTYHAWLPERGLLVSVFAVGEGRFGERLMDGLRP